MKTLPSKRKKKNTLEKAKARQKDGPKSKCTNIHFMESAQMRFGFWDDGLKIILWAIFMPSLQLDYNFKKKTMNNKKKKMTSCILTDTMSTF